jgi:hypothetical protein
MIIYKLTNFCVNIKSYLFCKKILKKEMNFVNITLILS